MSGSAEEVGWAAAEPVAAHVFLDDLADRTSVTGPDGHHLQRVRRLRTGEGLTGADGAGAWRRYDVVEARDGRLDLVATCEVRREPALVPRVSVAVALSKRAKLEIVAARLTEIGVHRILPVRALRSQVRWDAERAERALGRLRAVVREAAMQCRRARLPEVGEVVDLATLAGHDGLVVAERGGGPPEALPLPTGGEWLVVVGPEGGLRLDEVVRLGAPSVAVGPFVLRAETAPLAVAAALVTRSRARLL